MNGKFTVSYKNPQVCVQKISLFACTWYIKSEKEVLEEAFEAYCRLLIESNLTPVVLSLGDK